MSFCENVFLKSSILDLANNFNSLSNLPTVFFLSLSRLLKSKNKEVSSPFLPKYLILNSSISFSDLGLKELISLIFLLILSIILKR